MGLVGESGCGKSVTAMSIMRLIPNPPGKIVDGQILFEGQDLLKMSDEQIRKVRGNQIAMIFQDPMTSLNPVLTINRQISESLQLHLGMDGGAARRRSIELLDLVGIPSSKTRIDDYPHQFSGGMRQRVMIAMALLNSPELLIADEPTTALDVTVQAQIINLLTDLQHEFGTAIVLITHDLGVVADMADDVVVMYGGRIVERGNVDDIYYRPEMPYTLGLLGSVPRMDVDRAERLEPIPGQPPSLIRLPKGCVFRPRCPYHELVPGNRCAVERPELLPVTPDHAVRCHIEPARRREIALERLGVHAGATGSTLMEEK